MNNLLQSASFTTKEFNEIADELAPHSVALLNPHRSVLLGNYDVNVLEVALRRRGLAMRWHDSRQALEPVLAELEGAAPRGGLLLNEAARWFGGRHWRAFKPHGAAGGWLDLDSRLPAPRPLARPALCLFLQQRLQHGAQLLVALPAPAPAPA